MRKLNLLIIEAGFKTHKEFIVKCLLDTKMVNLYFGNGLHKRIDYSWLDKYSSGGFDFSYVKDDLTQKVLEFQKENKIEFDGVLTWVDTSVHFVNKLQHDLNLPVISQDVGKHLRNKGIVRERLKKDGVDTTFFKVIKSKKDLDDATKSKLKYPMVLKPTEMMASLGATKIESYNDILKNIDSVLHIDFKEEDLRELYGDISSEAILEEFLDGQGYSIECLVKNGLTEIIAINQKFTEHLYDVGNLIHPKISDVLQAKFKKLATQVHSSLRIQNSVTHLEVRENNNELKLIEANCRLGGDYIPFLMHKNGGVDVGKLLISAYTNQSIDLRFSKKKQRYASYLISNKEGRVAALPKLQKKVLEFKKYYNRNDLVFKNFETEKLFLGHIVSENRINIKKYNFQIEEPVFYGLNNYDREMMIFQANKDDLCNVLDIEQEAWNCKQAASVKTTKKRLNKNPTRFFIAFDLKTRQPVGLIYWVPVTKEEIDGSYNWDYFNSDEILNRDDTKFKYRYIVSISIKPTAPRGTGTLLLKSLEVFSSKNKINEFRYGLRLPNFHHHKQAGVKITDYLKGLNSGSFFDIGFKMAKNANGKVISLLEDYYNDPESSNYGLLISHKIGDKK